MLLSPAKQRFTCDSKTVAQRFPERQALTDQQQGELRSLQSTQSPSALGLAKQLESVAISSELSARTRCLDHLYPSSLKADREVICRQGLITQPRSSCRKCSQHARIWHLIVRRGATKRAMWQMSETERATSNRSHSVRVSREGVVGF